MFCHKERKNILDMMKKFALKVKRKELLNRRSEIILEGAVQQARHGTLIFILRNFPGIFKRSPIKTLE